jgi:hypothetical protein
VTARERSLLRDRVARARLEEERRSRTFDPSVRASSDPALKLESPEDALLAAVAQKRREFDPCSQ